MSAGFSKILFNSPGEPKSPDEISRGIAAFGKTYLLPLPSLNNPEEC
jgi:hypothetical protein